MLNVNALIGSHDVVLITLDSLRYDVADLALNQGTTPNLAALLPGACWEQRHAPGTFTYPSHQAIFAGFLPTPITPPRPARLFASRFVEAVTVTADTYVYDAPDLVSGLAAAGYHTICIGGVGFFNKQTSLGSVLPGLFAESHWHPSFAIRQPTSTEHQVRCAVAILDRLPRSVRVLLFVNISALHWPTVMYLPGSDPDSPDSVASQAAALAYVDRQLPPLFAAIRRRGPALLLVCSDHGTCYGEDGYIGHSVAHPAVWNVPYAELILTPA
jgi:sulfatase-like protein